MIRPLVITILLVTLASVAALLLCSCKPPAPPAPPKADAPLIVSVGGLGNSQLPDFDAAVTAAFPNVSLASMGSPNGYLADVAGYVNSHPHGATVILAGHSFGCATICRDAAKIGPIALMLLLDPVADEAGVSEMSVTANVRRCLVFRRGRPDIERQATVHGIFEEVVIDADHNGLPHDARCLQLSTEAIRGAL